MIKEKQILLLVAHQVSGIKSIGVTQTLDFIQKTTSIDTCTKI
jgi:hypothetical protein